MPFALIAPSADCAQSPVSGSRTTSAARGVSTTSLAKVGVAAARG
ncbi:hypothetical protein ACFZDK_17075 [Streptomyces sp. NPDC007901]